MYQKCSLVHVCSWGRAKEVGHRNREKVGAIKEKEKMNVCVHPL